MKSIKYKKIDIVIKMQQFLYKTNFENRKESELKKTTSVNILSPINIIKAIAKNHNKKDICKIINIGSIYGVRSPDFSIYNNINNINSEIYGGSKLFFNTNDEIFSSFFSKKEYYS